MDKFKMNLDREEMTSDQVQNYQNFNQLKKDFELLKKPFWKTPWFWGTGGLASTAIILSIGVLTNSKSQANEEINTIVLQDDIHQSTILNSTYGLSQQDDYQEPLISENKESSVVEPKSAGHKGVNEISNKPIEIVKKRRTIILDLIEEEFPTLQPLIGQELELLEGSKFDGRWFERTWGDIQLVTLGDNKYLIKFSDGNEMNKMYVKSKNS